MQNQLTVLLLDIRQDDNLGKIHGERSNIFYYTIQYHWKKQVRFQGSLGQLETLPFVPVVSAEFIQRQITILVPTVAIWANKFQATGDPYPLFSPHHTYCDDPKSFLIKRPNMSKDFKIILLRYLFLMSNNVNQLKESDLYYHCFFTNYEHVIFHCLHNIYQWFKCY